MSAKIVKNDDLSIASSYEGSADQSQYGGPWGDSRQYTHVDVPEGMDADCVEAVSVAADGEHGGVTFTADNAGKDGNDIILSFDGVQDIDAAVAEWNGANAGNTVSHNGTGTDVLGAGAIQLSGGGIELQLDSALVDAKTQSERDQKLTELRRQRDEKLEEADNQIKKHEDSDPNAIDTEANWKLHRIALRDLTDGYKDGGGQGTSALDGYELDMSDFDAWPVAPS